MIRNQNKAPNQKKSLNEKKKIDTNEKTKQLCAKSITNNRYLALNIDFFAFVFN